MSQTDVTSSTHHRWPAPVRSTDNPKPLPPIWDPTRRPPPPPSGRRGLLALAGPALALIAAGPALAAPDPDAQLVADVAEYLAADAAEWDMVADLLLPYPPSVQAESDRLCARMDELFERIVSTPASGLAGLRAKAKMLHRYLRLSDTGELLFPEESNADERMAWSFARDLIGGQA